MNQEKNEMQMSSAGEYLAPSVKMVEVKVRKVLCSSDGTITDMTKDSPSYY